MYVHHPASYIARHRRVSFVTTEGRRGDAVGAANNEAERGARTREPPPGSVEFLWMGKKDRRGSLGLAEGKSVVAVGRSVLHCATAARRVVTAPGVTSLTRTIHGRTDRTVVTVPFLLPLLAFLAGGRAAFRGPASLRDRNPRDTAVAAGETACARRETHRYPHRRRRPGDARSIVIRDASPSLVVGLLGWTRFHVGHGGPRARLAITILPSRPFNAASRKHRRVKGVASPRKPYL